MANDRLAIVVMQHVILTLPIPEWAPAVMSLHPTGARDVVDTRRDDGLAGEVEFERALGRARDAHPAQSKLTEVV